MDGPWQVLIAEIVYAIIGVLKAIALIESPFRFLFLVP